ncbi:MAG: hypothetical protein SOY73_08325 [Blautia sp.]|nr:hypothetical protein [Blautia sp.]MDY3999074.1 hypothetical protein [Blautia sp.]
MLLIILIAALIVQTFILFCCAAASNDPVSQSISDQEQMEFLKTWRENHPQVKKPGQKRS